MHELSIALSLLDVAGEERQRRDNPRVISLRLRLGPLAGVIREALLSAYEMAREGTDFAACQLVIEDVPVMIHCRTCNADHPVPPPWQLICPACGRGEVDLVSGRELDLAAMEIADETDVSQ
jgi:hydrogenase nickel incorporation protein HypA/HybF